MPDMTQLLNEDNEELVKSLGEYHDYSEEVVNQALEFINDPNFYTDGLFLVLLNSIKQGMQIGNISGGIIDSISDTFKDYNNQINLLNNSLTLYQKDISNSIGLVYQSITSNEIYGKSYTALNSIKVQIDSYTTESNNYLSKIDNIISDNKITSEEKNELNIIWERIQLEYPTFLDQASKSSIDTTPYTNKYNSLNTFMTALLSDNNVTNIDKTILKSKYVDYYNSTISLLTSIYNKLKNDINSIINNATAAAYDSGKILVQKSNSKLLNQDIINILNTISNDNIITPSEKNILKSKLDVLTDYYNLTVGFANSYGINVSFLNSAYMDLQSVIDSSEIFLVMTESNNINKDSLIASINNYFNAEESIYDLILQENKNILDSFSDDVDSHTTQLIQTDKEISLTAQSVSMLNNKVEVNRAGISLQSDKIIQYVSGTTIDRDIAPAIDTINSAGTNLFILKNSSIGTINIDGTISDIIIDEDRVSEHMVVAPNIDFTASIRNNVGENTITISWYDSEKKFLRIDTITDNQLEFYLSVISPSKAAYAIVSTRRMSDVFLQFEIGSVPTSYRLSSIDLIDNVILAKEQLLIKQNELNDFNILKSNILTNYVNDLNEFVNIVSDSLITPLEKNNVSDIWNTIKAENIEIQSLTSAYGIDDSLLDTYYASLDILMNDILLDMHSNSNVNKLDSENALTRYYNARNNIMDLAVKFLEEDVIVAEEEMLSSLSTSMDAQAVKNELINRAERLARNIGAVKELYTDEDEYIATTMSLLQSLTIDNVITPVEKVFIKDFLDKIKNEFKWYIDQANLYNIGSSEFINAKNILIDYISTGLTIDTLLISSNVDPLTYNDKFNDYYIEKQELNQDIINAMEGEYITLRNKVNEAINFAKLKDEETLAYQEAVNDAKTDILDINNSIDELSNTLPYMIRLESSKGDKFTDNNVDTVLTGSLIRGNINLTDTLPIEDFKFIWTKLDKDGNIDVDWNLAHINSGRSINITHEDILSKAIFNVEILQKEGVI